MNPFRTPGEITCTITQSRHAEHREFEVANEVLNLADRVARHVGPPTVRLKRRRQSGRLLTVCCEMSLMACFATDRGWALEIDLGHQIVVPNMAGQKLAIYVTGGELVNGIVLSVAINGGGKDVGGTPGPVITDIDVDAGPTIWNGPMGHNKPSVFNGGQLWNINFLTRSGYVAADGLVATLTVDTTGYFGRHTLELTGQTLSDELGETCFLGQDLRLMITNGTFGESPSEADANAE